MVGLPVSALRAILNSWRKVLFHPEQLKGGKFTETFMVLFSFFFGFAYNALHYFIYPGCAYHDGVIVYKPDLQFWLHHLSGGMGAVALFYYASVLGYYGVNLLGKKISYDRIQHVVFSCMFLYLTPLFPAFLFYSLNLRDWIYLELYEDWMGIPTGVLLTGILGTIISFRIFKSFGFGRVSSFFLSLLLLPLLYFGGKGAFLFLTRKAFHTSRPLRYALWTIYFSAISLLFWVAGKRRKKVLPVLKRMWMDEGTPSLL
ncbi:MAG: hypothetical protein QXV20_05155 [Candidatus Hadarchaeales archaeon]